MYFEILCMHRMLMKEKREEAFNVNLNALYISLS